MRPRLVAHWASRWGTHNKKTVRASSPQAGLLLALRTLGVADAAGHAGWFAPLALAGALADALMVLVGKVERAVWQRRIWSLDNEEGTAKMGLVGKVERCEDASAAAWLADIQEPLSLTFLRDSEGTMGFALTVRSSASTRSEWTCSCTSSTSRAVFVVVLVVVVVVLPPAQCETWRRPPIGAARRC